MFPSFHLPLVEIRFVSLFVVLVVGGAVFHEFADAVHSVVVTCWWFVCCTAGAVWIAITEVDVTEAFTAVSLFVARGLDRPGADCVVDDIAVLVIGEF